MVVDDEAEPMAEMIVHALRTDELSDAEVMISPVEQSIRLRAGSPTAVWGAILRRCMLCATGEGFSMC